MSSKKKVLIAVAVLGVLAVAVPSWLRARVAAQHPPAVLGDTRTLISAMTAYESVNGGFADGRIECLAEPWGCIPGYGRDKPTFLDPVLAQPSLTKSGYQRSFVAGPAVPREESRTANASATSVRCWASVAVPVATGMRSWCGDCTGRLCVYDDGQKPPLTAAGECGSRAADGTIQPVCRILQ